MISKACLRAELEFPTTSHRGRDLAPSLRLRAGTRRLDRRAANHRFRQTRSRERCLRRRARAGRKVGWQDRFKRPGSVEPGVQVDQCVQIRLSNEECMHQLAVVRNERSEAALFASRVPPLVIDRKTENPGLRCVDRWRRPSPAGDRALIPDRRRLRPPTTSIHPRARRRVPPP